MEYKINERSQKRIMEYQEAFRRINAEQNSFINGLMSQMDVPDGYTINPKTWAFEEKKESAQVQ